MDSQIRFTDAFFAKAISDISAENTLYFTTRQFLYLLEKRLNKRRRFSWGCLGIFANFLLANAAVGEILAWGIFIVSLGLLLAGAGIGWLLSLLVVSVGILVLLLGLMKSNLQDNSPRELLIEPSMVDDWLQRGSLVNSLPEKLLSSSPAQTISATVPADITAYSFDRLVASDNDDIVRILIANNFHFEHNCAILSISGYPQNIFATAMEMLRRNQQLRVFALHDCSPNGLNLVRQLRANPDWFPDTSIAIVDIGLLPRQILAAKRGIVVQNSAESAGAAKNLSAPVRENLSAAELQWLEAGNFVELESFTPQRLIQVLQKSIASLQEVNISEGGDSILTEGNGDGFYTIDSFG